MKVKNIILDFGGVIIDVDYQRAADAFEKLGAHDFAGLYSKKSQASFFDDFETGRLSDEAFRQMVRRYLPAGISDSQIDQAWNSMVESIPPARVDFLKQLKKHYRLFLLSNTNLIHVRDFTQKLNRQFGENLLPGLFEKIYLSCQIGMRKPDVGIFKKVMTENGLKYEETLFIDDSLQHVEGAEKAGLTALHLDLSRHTLETFLPAAVSVPGYLNISS